MFFAAGFNQLMVRLLTPVTCPGDSHYRLEHHQLNLSAVVCHCFILRPNRTFYSDTYCICKYLLHYFSHREICVLFFLNVDYLYSIVNNTSIYFSCFAEFVLRL